MLKKHAFLIDIVAGTVTIDCIEIVGILAYLKVSIIIRTTDIVPHYGMGSAG
jgi:hypothetical protein